MINVIFSRDMIDLCNLSFFVSGFDPEDFSLVAGDVRISDRSGKEQLRKVIKIVNHEDYDPDTISYDIGLLFLEKPFIINDSVAPIPLPEQGQETKGENNKSRDRNNG